jgi:energy-coupling factor transporter ATP-binding protein EcfA2
MLFVGPPACGKSRVVSMIADLIEDNELKIMSKDKKHTAPLFPFTADSITAEALSEYLAKECTKIFTTDDGKDYVHASCTMLVEELGVFLKKRTEDTVNMLNQLYDARNYRYYTKQKGKDDVKNVCVSLVAGTTPSFIRECFNENLISQGFTSRFVVVYQEQPRFLRQFTGFTDDQLQARADLVKHMKALSKRCGPVPMSEECAAYHKRRYESGSYIHNRINTSPKLDMYYARKNIHLQKLALCIQMGKSADSQEIELESFKQAEKFIAETEIFMHLSYDLTGRNAVHEFTRKLADYIGNSPDGISHKRVWLDWHSDLKKDELEAAIEFLMQTDQITAAKKNGKLVYLPKSK